ncbi:PREDICTED: voltage-dependent T-type calcium channel subunit alpha-1H-like, partial [Thamnophis sirtalis]|uniref:Voltage-dependent T-type calcium channel subunit alpha-1H-like n=1 Tax=Thamnophis sirtalis TaxID=35019 RepID=A0A6I9Z460_9SAUR
MLVILLNCVTLGMFQPCQDIRCQTERCTILEAFDHFIFAFFAVEMIIKMIALGIFGHKCYLGDTWNRLDFFIVIAGMMEYSLDGHNVSLSAIRTVRVLRPLRAINRVPSMRILVTLLLDTLPMLGNVLLLCFFVFFIFGIVGVQLWAGLLRNRCFLDSHIQSIMACKKAAVGQILVLLLVYICWLGIMGAVGPCHPEIQGFNDYYKYFFLLSDNNGYEIYIMALL